MSPHPPPGLCLANCRPVYHPPVGRWLVSVGFLLNTILSPKYDSKSASFPFDGIKTTINIFPPIVLPPLHSQSLEYWS